MKSVVIVLGVLYLMYRANPLYGINIKQGKNGARFKVLRPELLHALSVARTVFISFNKQITVTEGWRNDKNSLHYYGLAVDLRANNLTSYYQKKIRDKLQAALGSDYQVILHGRGSNIHFHIEYDPNRTGVRGFQT